MPIDIAALLLAVQPPEVFAPNTEAFWDDDHISMRMLAAHLDSAFEGASRQYDFMDASARWIYDMMPPARYPRLWDFGCGPGLYATRLARLGYTVTGLDLSRRSIAYAIEDAQRMGLTIRYRVQNYLQLHEENVCDAAVMIYCDYGALSGENRAVLLQNVYRALAPGGLFLLDVFTRHKLAAFQEQRVWAAYPKGGFWSESPHVALQDNRRYPGRISLEQTVVAKENTLHTFYIWNQYFTQDTLAAEARSAGFAVKKVTADVSGAPQNEQSETMAMLLQKP